jgi:hypothetical protein
MELNTKTIDLTEAVKPEGVKQVISALMYGSYRANRGYGMTHEQLLSIGIGNDAMRAMYELEKQNNGN